MTNIERRTKIVAAAAKRVPVQSLCAIALLLGTAGLMAGQNAITECDAIAVTTELSRNPTISPGCKTAGGTSLYLCSGRKVKR